MRRPGLLIAGMLLAAGAGLAVANPASAAVGHSGADTPRWYHCHYHNGSHWNDWDDDWDDWGARRDDQSDHRRWCHTHRYRGHGHGHGHGNGHVSVNLGNGDGIHVGIGHDD